MISIKDYAKDNRVTYEAIRKQIIKYKEDLGTHLIRVGRTQYLDADGVRILNEKRNANNVIYISNDKNEQIEILKNENKAMLLKIAELQELLIREKSQVQLLQEEKIQLLQEKEIKNKWFNIFRGK